MKMKSSTRYLTLLSMFTAVMIVLYFTPLAFLPVGSITLTLLQVPVAVGAILLGPGAGAFLGGVFGLLSLLSCFGKDPTGVVLMGISPLRTILLCLLPRILMGLLVGLIFRAMQKRDKTRPLSYPVASVSGALLNTLLFLPTMILLFYNTDFVQSMGKTGFFAILGVVFMSVLLQFVVETLVCLFLGTALAKALSKLI